MLATGEESIYGPFAGQMSLPDVPMLLANYFSDENESQGGKRGTPLVVDHRVVTVICNKC
jgi:hypothetical protein